MSVNYNEINIPINAEKRDPFHGRSKAEIGLGLTPNMSYQSLETAILANVRSTIDEGVAYNYPEFANESAPILANVIKLKPSSSRATIHFSLGTWTNNSEFIPRETATLELRANKTNVSYNLYVTEPYPNNSLKDSTDDMPNRTTAMTSTKVIIRQFNTGGWLVQLKVIDWKVDAIWINVVESKNIDLQNPMMNIYDESEFGRNIEFYCDKSRISTNLEIGGTDLIAKSLNHDVPIKLVSVDPDDYYNSTSRTHTFTNIDLSGVLGTATLNKDDSLVSIPIKTDVDTCENDQLIPMSVNRLNHQIKFRLNGAVHPSLRESWRSAQTDQTNLNTFLDTDPEAVNEYPISITELTHDINLEIGNAEYNGSVPESGNIGGEDYNRYELKNGKINYATIQDNTSGRDEYYSYNKEDKEWNITSSKFDIRDKSTSLNTKPDFINSLNLVLHGLDHDMKIEVVNKDYRVSRGSATDKNQLWNSLERFNTGIRNLTWDIGESDDLERRRNSYVTGHMNLNTFEKDVYQCLDLTVHGLDHNINLDFYRIDVHKLRKPSSVDISRTDRFRPNSGGQDIKGQLSIDTFTGRVQNNRLEVIDGRYSDCTRGLALKMDGNFMPWDQIDNYGDYGSCLPTAPTTDEIEEIYPTINGIPFTGDYRYTVYYPTVLERDGVSKKHSVRNIVIPAYHKGTSLADAGEHKWETLTTQRIASYSSNNEPVSKLISNYNYDRISEISEGYGLTKLTKINVNQTGTETERYNKMKSSLGSDSDSISVYAFKSVLEQSDKSNSSIYVSKNELSVELSKMGSSLQWKEAVDTYEAIGTTYPNPEDGWTVNVKDTDITYRYTGTNWIAISANSIPVVSTSVDGKMSAADKRKLNGIESNANNYILPQATKDMLGGVVIGDNISLTSGIISLTKDNVTNALGYTPPVSDTTYNVATSLVDGLMSKDDRVKLDAIEEGANRYVLPNATSSSKGGVIVGSNITVNSGEISLTKDNVTNALGYTPPVSDTTYSNATDTTPGLMSDTDKKKLNGIAEGANRYVLPNATSSSKGGVIVGDNLSINSNGVISLSTTNVLNALGYTPPKTDTTYSNATTESAGLMSSGDKTKLDGIAINANNYVLPKATNTTLGGITVGKNITLKSGEISLSSSDVINALGYTPIKDDLDTTYGLVTYDTDGLMSKEDKAKLDKDIYSKGEINALLAGLDTDLSGLATQDSDGLMSSEDKTKLDNIAENANNYVLPKATSSVLGGVIVGNNIGLDSNGRISLGKTNVTTALGYEPAKVTLATKDDAGLMSASDKAKLDNQIYTKSDIDGMKSNIDTTVANTVEDPSSRMSSLLSQIGDEDLITGKTLKEIINAINYRFEKLETNAGI